MSGRIPKAQLEESYKRVKETFSNIPDEELKTLYWDFYSQLEHDAVILDFIPILVEKSLRNHLLANKPNALSDQANQLKNAS